MKEVSDHVGWKGKVQLKCGEGRKVLGAVRVRPFQEGRALVAYLIGRGLKPLQEVW